MKKTSKKLEFNKSTISILNTPSMENAKAGKAAKSQISMEEDCISAWK